MIRQTLFPVRGALSMRRLFVLLLGLALAAAALGRGLGLPVERGDGRAPHGRLEITIAAAGSCVTDARQAFRGSLRLRRLDERVEAFIPGPQIAAGAASRRELPAGTYAMSWLRDPLAPASQSAWSLRGSSLVSVFAGETTRLELRQAGEACNRSSDDLLRRVLNLPEDVVAVRADLERWGTGTGIVEGGRPGGVFDALEGVPEALAPRVADQPEVRVGFIDTGDGLALQ
jgi:hypothetical protein